MKAVKKAAKGAGRSAGRSVLIIDDEPAFLDIFSTIFREVGWTVHCAENGAVGLKGAESHRPDVILLDLIMPVKDGFETLRGLKSDPKTRAIPVIILSNLGQDFEIQTGMNLGAAQFLVKAAIEPAAVVEEATRIADGQGGRSEATTRL